MRLNRRLSASLLARACFLGGVGVNSRIFASTIFNYEIIADTDIARVFIFPPDTARAGEPWGALIDVWGNDYFEEAYRLISHFGEGWIYYSFNNPATGKDEPKASYIKGIDWEGNPAAIGAGLYRRDLPGTCQREEVNAVQLEEHPSSQRLQEFVHCATMELETTGYFGLVSLSTDPSWRSHSIYLFSVDMYGNTLFTGNPYNWGMGISPSELTTIAVRDDVAVAEAFGETFLYYTSVNPSNGMPQRKASFVKRVVTFGVPILIGAGYYLGGEDFEVLGQSAKCVQTGEGAFHFPALLYHGKPLLDVCSSSMLEP